MSPAQRPLHLLFFDESSADHLIDRRLHECRANPFPLPSTLAEVRDELAVIADVCSKVIEAIDDLLRSVRPGSIKLNSINKSPSRSRGSSVFPCQSRCLRLSKRLDTSAPVSGRSSCKAFVCCCNTVSRMVMFIEFFR